MTHLSAGNPIYVTQQMWIPDPMISEAGSEQYGYLSFGDFHSDGNHTCPGMMLDDDGDGTFEVAWGCGFNGDFHSENAYPMPTDEWFTLEQEWAWKTSGVAIRYWINGDLAAEQLGAKTKNSGDSDPALYFKLYGTRYSSGLYSPNPVIYYRKNITITDERLP